MKPALFLYALLLGIYVADCSKAVEGNNSGTSGMKPVEKSSINSEVLPQNTPSPPIEILEPNPRDVVLFDGKNYIKMSGWNKPSKNDTYIDETYDQGDPLRFTKSGKQVKTNTIHYGFRKLSLYSEDFYFEGQDLDYLKGKLDLVSFLEMSAKGKVFFYSVTAQKVVPNNDLPEGPFGYKIMDTDGDGVFETLLGDYDEIIVPNWVLK